MIVPTGMPLPAVIALPGLISTFTRGRQPASPAFTRWGARIYGELAIGILHQSDERRAVRVVFQIRSIDAAHVDTSGDLKSTTR